jgi:hypothetical protein
VGARPAKKKIKGVTIGNADKKDDPVTGKNGEKDRKWA